LQSCPDSFSTVVAYASIANSDIDNDHDLKLLKAWCKKVPIEIETLAEEIHPSEPSRPLWSEVLQKIERRAITTLVVPSLFHIAGDDFITLSKFLIFLKAHGVALKSLAEVIDSRRVSQNDIVLRLVLNTRKTAGGVQ